MSLRRWGNEGLEGIGGETGWENWGDEWCGTGK